MGGPLVAQGLIGTAIGAGILIGATGFYVFLKIVQKMKTTAKEKHIDAMGLGVAVMEEISVTQNLHRSTRNSYKSHWVVEGEDSDDEKHSFFSCEDEGSSIYSLDEVDNLEVSEICDIFEEVDQLLGGDEMDHLNAYSLLKKNEHCLKQNPDFLWRMAKFLHFKAKRVDDCRSKQDYIRQGLMYAEKALRIDPDNYDAHKWYGILIGMQAEFLSVKEKINYGLRFQEHLNIALSGKPKDASLHHLLGRFKYEIAILSWIERKMALFLFPELPSFVLEDALKHFKDAEKFHADWIENRLFLFKCYIELRDYKSARKFFDLTKYLRPITPEDSSSLKEMLELGEKYSVYFE